MNTMQIRPVYCIDKNARAARTEAEGILDSTAPREALRTAALAFSEMTGNAKSFQHFDLASWAWVRHSSGSHHSSLRIPCVSPDCFWSKMFCAGGSFMTLEPERKLKKVGINGGPVQVLVDASVLTTFTIPDWGSDNNIWVTTNGGLLRVQAAGGKPQTLARADPKKNEIAFLGAQITAGRNPRAGGNHIECGNFGAKRGDCRA